MSVSLTSYIHISCFLLQNVVSQYPTMFGMPGMPQIIPYQTPMLQTNYYETEFHSKHKHKHSRRSEGSSSESSSGSSESEDDSGEDRNCDMSCDQCTLQQIPNCNMFCNSCMNQGILIVPYPYPVVMPNIPTNPAADEDTSAKSEKNVTDKGDKNVTDKSKAEDEKVVTDKGEKEGENDVTDKGEKDVTDKGEKEATDEIEDNVKNKDNGRRSIQNPRKNQNIKSQANIKVKANKPNKKAPEKSNNINITQKRKVKGKLSTKQNNENEVYDTVKVLLESQKASSLPVQDYKDIIFKVPNKGNTKYVLTSMRRVKENWLPKFGIVPIPEKVATDLMTRIRDLSIQPLRETHKITGEVTHTNSIQDPGLVHESETATTEPSHFPRKLETILVRDAGSGRITIEGSKTAVQSLNRRMLDDIKPEKFTDDLPIELVKKIYQY